MINFRFDNDVIFQNINLILLFKFYVFFFLVFFNQIFIYVAFFNILQYMHTDTVQLFLVFYNPRDGHGHVHTYQHEQ